MTDAEVSVMWAGKPISTSPKIGLQQGLLEF
ncbi:MAG: hypothetical protein ACJAXA_002479 [Candidatus Aldehydirespiratoraceae bacterium]|jgi:hypothetical protein